MENNRFHDSEKKFISVNFTFVFKERNAEVTFAEKTQIKINSLNTQQHSYLI